MSSREGDNVLKYDGQAGAFFDEFVGAARAAPWICRGTCCSPVIRCSRRPPSSVHLPLMTSARTSVLVIQNAAESANCMLYATSESERTHGGPYARRIRLMYPMRDSCTLSGDG